MLIARYRATDPRACSPRYRSLGRRIRCNTRRDTDHAMDLLLNRWAIYQTLACRMWARAGFYQASGAYGFGINCRTAWRSPTRVPTDARPRLARGRPTVPRRGCPTLVASPSGVGVRTRISDDGAWLAYATVHYVAVTGDVDVLDETIPFLEGPAVSDGAADAYFQPQASDEAGSLFEHCARALDQSLIVGPHGLPLIGTGDWNDGMNRVGPEGKGESVWLGWLLHDTLTQFAPHADARRDTARAQRWHAAARALKVALERDGWDGNWYRRAYFDDGTPLGSAANDACRIDSIAQSWAVISGASDMTRAAAAMTAVDRLLVRRDDRLVLLFTPPFDVVVARSGLHQGLSARHS